MLVNTVGIIIYNGDEHFLSKMFYATCVNSFGRLHTRQIYSLSMYNLIFPGNLSHNLVIKYCTVGASLGCV